MRAASPLLLSLTLALCPASACVSDDRCDALNAISSEQGAPRIHVVGDSILAWGDERCASAGHQLALVLDETVQHNAVSGAEIIDGIPEQYQNGAWDVVVLNGGANDVNRQCGCGDCEQVFEAVHAAREGMVDAAHADGAHVLIAGYLGIRDDADYGFSRCAPAFDRLDADAAALADADPNVTFVDLDEVVSAETSERYDQDGLHPNEAGAAAIAERLAQVIRAIRSNR